MKEETIQTIKDDIKNIDWNGIKDNVLNIISDYFTNFFFLICLCLFGYLILRFILKKGIKIHFEIHDKINQQTIVHKNATQGYISIKTSIQMFIKKIESIEKDIKKIGIEQNQIMLQLKEIENYYCIKKRK
jgi:hypothetical protein